LLSSIKPAALACCASKPTATAMAKVDLFMCCSFAFLIFVVL
jgi:hypothetical protein